MTYSRSRVFRHIYKPVQMGIALALSTVMTSALAEVELAPKVSVGAGARASFTSTDVSAPNGDSKDLNLDSLRLYINGGITDQLKFTLNTEYDNASNEVEVMDAIARFEFSEKFNIWAGRFLPPSDRANLYGPYYANHWGVYRDGIQDGYPFIFQGRDNGIAYWGDFGRVKISLGAFDTPDTVGPQPSGESDLLTAARLQINFWDLEPGYYLNGTYYGEKDIFSIGLAGQSQDSNTAATADVLIETKLGGGVITFEGEYASYDELGGYGIAPVSDGGYGLAAYLFPQVVNLAGIPGQFQILGKYAVATHETAGSFTDQDTAEVNLNYIIKAFNARVSLFWVDTTFDGPAGTDSTQIGLGLQFQI